MTANRHALELLRQADPVSRTEHQRLREHAGSRLDDVLSVVLAARPHETRQVRLRRTRIAIVVVLVIAAALVVAPALGLGVPGIDFFRAEKAPPKAVELFDSLSVGAPPGMDPQAIPGEARRLETTTVTGETRVVWIAPTKAGGLCYFWAGTGGGGGCDKLGTTPLSVTWLGRRDLLLGDALRPGPSDFGGVAVHASERYVASVELHFADGTVVTPPIAWVSEPIGQGFFHHSFTPQQLRPGHEISAVVALDAGGDVLIREATCCEVSTGLPADAIADEKSETVSIPTSAGTAVIWVAPTAYEGTCAWLELDGRARPLGRCLPKGYDRNDGLFLTFLPTQETVIVYGSAADRYARLELHYADGDVERLTPSGQFFLAEIPARHLQPDTRLLTMTVRDAEGREIPNVTFTFPARGSAASPCYRVLPLSPGESCD